MSDISESEIDLNEMDINDILLNMINNLELNQIRDNNIEAESTNQPLSIDGYTKLTEYKLWFGSEESCNICLEKFKWLENITELPCKHKYHSDCIYKWFKNSSTCPTCRYNIYTNKPGYNIDTIIRNIRITFSLFESILRNIR